MTPTKHHEALARAARELMANKYSLQASVDKLARVLEKALYR
ncbi:glycosyltransferase [Cutibacterium acnes JCM 18916]|nr:glycosyltransferase [Cutibacterium acnes JCM 18916]